MPRRIAIVAISLLLVVVLSLTGAYAGCSPYSPPEGGEVFAAKGKLSVPDAPPDKEEFVRELTEQETSAFRYFIEEADYEEYSELYKDRAYVPVVLIDGVRWWVYRSSLFRVDGGDVKWRKTVSGFSFTSPADRHEIDFHALVAWYESKQ